jgi:hypothetical protein
VHRYLCLIIYLNLPTRAPTCVPLCKRATTQTSTDHPHVHRHACRSANVQRHKPPPTMPTRIPTAYRLGTCANTNVQRRTILPPPPSLPPAPPSHPPPYTRGRQYRVGICPSQGIYLPYITYIFVYYFYRITYYNVLRRCNMLCLFYCYIYSAYVGACWVGPIHLQKHRHYRPV